MAWAVMCCGCGRMLNKDGSLGIVFMDVATGLFNYATDDAIERAEVADFDTHESADALAVEYGWTVLDTIGPNHRCPECSRREPSDRRGAYIPWGNS